MENSELNITLLKQGDKTAFAHVYDLYSAMIFSKLMRMVKDRMVAEEILQEVFLKVWERREKIDPSQSLKSWIYAIAINLVYDYYRKLSRDHKMQQVLLDQFADLYYANNDDGIFEERKKLLDEALAQLPPQRFAVFKLCRLEGKSYQQAAEELGISPSTVSNQLVQATKTLKEYIFNSKTLLILIISWFFQTK
ncbi:sigma-70 family RNA polymerase sigma factor [Mucilaginibacter sp. RS28]|uniref:RNA polymerase sigma factor n=1 Tax=Mucilaginibacter straminoryzae TaxID=2932774 RepID=A0A9X1X0I1_9SPHI|nr:sigma-70 family RNA polymerase sigma factor [Mucilaginibacter straminoryzae]MCJ8208987.1 sigma-70 family RNA polymerase sigma factor [Mucilaginibacter straminoryzae]